MELSSLKKTKNITIIGGGEAGCQAAIALSKIKDLQGFSLYQITLVEKNSQLLQGTSSITPGRLGQGYYYAHLDTASNYLKQTIAFMQKYPNCIVGKHLERSHPIRHGRYVVMKTSIPEPCQVFDVYMQIQKTYEELVIKNPNNKIWGELNDFLKLVYISNDQTWFKAEDNLQILQNQNDNEEIAKSINLENVAFIVETAEELLDLKLYRQQVLDELSLCPSITILKDLEVIKLHHDGGQNFTINCINNKNQLIDLKTNIPVICNWERSENLIRTLSTLSRSQEKVTNRLKSIITIKLPKNMINSHSYFFCMGPYAMFANLGNGFGKITYAQATNMQKIDAFEEMPREMLNFLNHKISNDQKQEIAKNILEGAKKFIPAFSEVILDDVVDVDFGIVKTRGSESEIDINNPLGKIGQRDYGWVRKHEVDHGKAFVIENNAMKIVYSLSNALETVGMIHEAFDDL